jgi:hypothetical protein
MANPNLPPESPLPPSLSAAELRRRLLASTPPPLAATSAVPEDADPALAEVGTPAWAAGAGPDLLNRLKMPGKSGPVPAPAVRPVVPVVDPDPVPPPRPSVNRRTPIGGMRYDPASALAGALEDPPEEPEPTTKTESKAERSEIKRSPEYQRLKSENKELRKLLDEMKQLLQEASDNEQQHAMREKESQVTLAAKDAQVQELSAQLGTIEEQIARGELAPPPPIPKTRTELEEWADELEKESAKLNQERRRVEEERRQLREDEQGLETQMREMEVSMARERAILARQETELKRLSAEIQHELELMQRGDAGLREQMAKFQRRAQEVVTRPNGPPGRR